MNTREDWVLVCPACGKPAASRKRGFDNLYGIIPLGFKCKNCGHSGVGPIKIRAGQAKAFATRVTKRKT